MSENNHCIWGFNKKIIIRFMNRKCYLTTVNFGVSFRYELNRKPLISDENIKEEIFPTKC